MLNKFSNCDQVEPFLDAFLDQELSLEEDKLVAAHLADCHKCQIRVEETRLLVNSLASLPRLALPNALECDWDSLVKQKNMQKPVVSLFAWSKTSWWTVGALAAVAILLLLTQWLFIQRSKITVATNAASSGSIAEQIKPDNLAVPDSKGASLLTAKQEGMNEHSTGAYEDLLAVYPAESSSFSEEVGISTDEDGLYALKL